MARYRVTTPAAGHTGQVGTIHFADGRAEVDSEAHEASLAYCRQAGYTVEELGGDGKTDAERGTAAAAPEPAEPFDPSARDVGEVLAYLDGAGEAEAVRVLDAEAAGKARKGVLDQREAILARERGVSS